MFGAENSMSRRKIWGGNKPPSEGYFSRPLRHITRKHLPASQEISHSVRSPSGTLRRPKMTLETQYSTTFTENKNETFKKRNPKRTSPTRVNRPHPMNVYYLQKLDSKVVCNVNTTNNHEPLNLFGVPAADAKMDMQTVNRADYKDHIPSNRTMTTRYGCNRMKRLPSIGIVPVCPDVNNPQKSRVEDHWLPGCLKMTTTMTLDGPYQYLPRKRKEVILDSSAAGIRGSVRQVMNRFNCDAKLKDNPSQTITVRSAI